MDISSTTSSSATMSTADTNASAKSQKSSKSDSSFKDEMNKVEKNEDTKNSSTGKSDEKTENRQESNSDDIKGDKDSQDIDLNQSMLLNGEINLSISQTASMGQKSMMLSDNFQTLIDANQQLASITMMAEANSVSSKVDYSNIQMDSNDAKFFSDLVQNPDKTLQNVVADLQGGIEQTVQEASKNVKVSATLMNALSEAVKNNQSFRIDFDKDISVIIKVDKDGALSAKFIPGDKAVEEYLKQNMSSLRQRFDEQELSYKDLSYSRQQQRQNQNRRNNKENNHE